MKIVGSKKRIRLLAALIMVVGLLFVVRLFYLQIIRGEYFVGEADHQYFKPKNIFERGTIFFSIKDDRLVTAATQKLGFLIQIKPQIVGPNATTTFAKLKGILPELNEEEFMAKANKKNDPNEEIARRVAKESADKIKALDLKGVITAKEKWRFYPAGRTASKVIGFLGYQGDDYAARYGVEKSYDDVLSRSEEQSFKNFFIEIFSEVGTVLRKNNLTTRGDVVLSIEPVVQNFLEKKLSEVMSKQRSDSVQGMIIDPQTGAIYAMASLPDFDPNESKAELATLNNPFLMETREMGSIIKPLTIAAGLDLRVVTADTVYNDTGSIKVSGKTISNHDKKARGRIPIQEILTQSLNVGTTFVQQKIGQSNFREYFKNYGLGEKTDIDLPGEIAGKIKNLDGNIDVDFANASFGQGIATTPIGTVRALCSLANGGVLVKPYVVREIRFDNLLTKETKPIIIRRVLKPETSKEISRMLVKAVDTSSALGKIKLTNYSIAAKTGTAQMANPAGGGYYADRFLHSFFGYFPASNPRFLVFLYTVYPKEGKYSNETLAEPFSEITKFLLNYYQIPPDR